MESVNAKNCASQNNFMVCKTNPGPGAGDIVNSSSRADDATDSDQLTLNAYTPTIDEGWTECESWRRPRHGNECRNHSHRVIPMAGRSRVACGDVAQRRHLGAAAVRRVRAARVKVTAARWIQGRWDLAAYRLECAVAQVHARHLVEERAGVGMVRAAEQHRGGRALHDAPEVHDHDPVPRDGRTTPRSWLMNRYVSPRSARRRMNRLSICAWMETSERGHRFVADEELRRHRERTGWWPRPRLRRCWSDRRTAPLRSTPTWGRRRAQCADSLTPRQIPHCRRCSPPCALPAG